MLHRVVALATGPQSLFELAAAGEVFGTARPEVPSHYSWSVCTRTPGLVPIVGGGELNVAFGLERLEQAETVVVTGYVEYEKPAHPDVLLALRKAHERGARIVSICSGAFLLAQAGLLTGRSATLHWRMEQDFRRLHPEVDLRIDALYLSHPDVATSAGTAAGIDLCLELVRHDFGAAYASQVARHMVMPPHREGGQLQYRTSPEIRDTGTATLGPLLEWATAHLSSDLSVEVLAGRSHTSARTLSRRFVDQLGVSPGRWILAQRIDAARALLEGTNLTVDTIANRVGLSTATNLRRRFHASVGISPAAYRRTFQAATRPSDAPDGRQTGSIHAPDPRGSVRGSTPIR